MNGNKYKIINGYATMQLQVFAINLTTFHHKR